MIKFIFNKVLFLILFQTLFLSLYLFPENSAKNYDTVNVRKAFFLYELGGSEYRLRNEIKQNFELMPIEFLIRNHQRV